mmetsp:Transcript_49718/g.124975  ORF Transcript_49718/g.124975 Transcript_49718/m.124975 type:complete len:224 (-) Transcript_49718:330-1001(-)
MFQPHLFVAAVGFYYLFHLVGYILHRIVHCEWSGIFHQVHMRHHTCLYPTSSLQTDQYVSESGSMRIKALPALLAAVLARLFFNVGDYFLLFVLEMIFLACVSELLHRTYHLRHPPAWLDAGILHRRWRAWRRMHFAHHNRPSAQFFALGCFDPLLDALLHTAPPPHRPAPLWRLALDSAAYSAATATALAVCCAAAAALPALCPLPLLHQLASLHTPPALLT